MKKSYILMVLLLLALSTAACGKKSASVIPTATETAAESTIQETSAEAQDSKTKEISGTVIDAAMHSLVLKSGTDGAELMFTTEGADINLEEGLVVGSEVLLVYTGELKGTDASKVKVLEIKDKADNQSLDEGDRDMMDFNILQGTIVKGSETSVMITIRTEDGVDVTFKGSDVTKIVTTSEITTGKDVALAYQGEYNGKDLNGLKLLLLLDDQSTWEVRMAQGTTVYNMMNSFEIRSEDGTQIAFTKDGCGKDAEAMTHDSGDLVAVTYISTQNGENYPLYIGETVK